MFRRLAFALTFALSPVVASAAPEPLEAYPEDASEQLEFLSRCAGLVRAWQTGRIDFDYYTPLVPKAFNEKHNRFWKVIRPRTMELFGFNPEDLTVLDADRRQMYHAFVVSAGVDGLIERGAGFYETMSKFRESAPDWGDIILKDFETCGAAEFE